jgi:hypothetical protein
VKWLNANGASNIVALINNITYISPGNLGVLYSNANTVIYTGSPTNPTDIAAMSGTLYRGNIPITTVNNCGHDFGCIVNAVPTIAARQASPCPTPTQINQAVPFYPKSSFWNLLGSGSTGFAFGSYWDYSDDTDDSVDDPPHGVVESKITYILP